ncbi:MULTISPECIES: DUF423 domain-containing protein [unclassified Mesorhizobium]|uniref:DUF423 domain-containing protein n=1 Tax=unclassified Mesorhizobium TaxID=325217 RepID=UPI00048A1881|nr:MULTISPECIES: DUF423 domain-containing protein [unclassified Mesorhizobium]ARP66208.1 DUF423 domain-containing protein [Mesorhizobium sp. WSM1497]RUX70607.1 DUF423 domain-containing protein [Mesorhizobium sp. M7A.F.Ca.US.005.03.1.1]RUY17516.1 DUF423 domain-containing protein [Mesorhizobium sp. M7A.F.Ca.US.005.03.2.1]RUY31734.1 DUF423 domain-containing protein [Mesorhizobium sp. M7A.F.Ca.US.001.04.2.1]RUY37252.1 DUF423 domain-containing protein [Mesorhizobium sp. M7A.F.Ca.US.001.04.1.1]
MSTAERPSDDSSRILVLAGGLCGAAGVALSAAAAHLGGAFVGTAASFLLMHAPVFLAAGLLGANRILRIGSLILLVGLLLFCGDLLARDFIGSRLFPLSAPIGGTLLIAGWLAIAASALVRVRS